MIYFWGGNGRRDWMEFSFIGDGLFFKKRFKTNMANFSIPVE